MVRRRKKENSPTYKAAIKEYDEYYAQYLPPAFRNREEVAIYLQDEVFVREDFKNNVKEAAEYNKVSYLVAFDVISNYIIDNLELLDQLRSHRRKQSRINIFGYLVLDIGFIKNINRNYFKKEIQEFRRRKQQRIQSH